MICSSLYAQQSIYVSPDAPKGGKGTLKAPYGSIQEAQTAVRKLAKRQKGDITVFLRGGIYRLSSPLVFGVEDSGRNGYMITYKAFEKEIPVISGGQTVSGWKPTSNPHIYSAAFSSDKKLRALFVNGERARMATVDAPVQGKGSWGKMEISGGEPWAFGAGTAVEGIKFLAKDLPALSNPEDIELIQRNDWNEKILCVSDVAHLDNDTTVLKLQQPYGAILTSLKWAGKTRYTKNFIIRNTFGLLDSPGEFYFDRLAQRLYYYTDSTDLDTANVIAPISEGLIHIYGESTGKRAKNLAFEGITFSHDAWELMEVGESYGFGGVQSLGLAYKYISDGNWHPTKYNSTNTPAGSIDLKNAENISFMRNRFVQLNSGTSLNCVNDVVDARIAGNYFSDLLGNAVTVGHPQHYAIGDGAIFGPDVEGVCRNIQVTNNYIRNVSLDFRMVEAILAFFVEGVSIDHNDIYGTPYGAIAVGWWWANAGIPPSIVAKDNTIDYNRIGKTNLVLNDGGMIYMLGEQPNSEIVGNYLFDGPRAIYPDDGSAYLTIRGNFVNSLYNQWLHIASDRCHDMVIRDNFTKTNFLINKGVNSKEENTVNYRNRPFGNEALAIQAAAGIEEGYRDIIPDEEPARIDIYPWVPKDAWGY